MNVNKYCCTTSNQSKIIADDRIYEDSTGRPVGLAGRVNRITNSVEVPQRIPLFTPEDKMKMDLMFNKIINTIENAKKAKI